MIDETAALIYAKTPPAGLARGSWLRTLHQIRALPERERQAS